MFIGLSLRVRFFSKIILTLQTDCKVKLSPTAQWVGVCGPWLDRSYGNRGIKGIGIVVVIHPLRLR